MARRFVIAGLAAALILLGQIPASASAAVEPVPFTSASGLCNSGEVTFPVQGTAHPDAIFKLHSIGAEGTVGSAAVGFGPGDTVWGAFGEVHAGTAPTLSVFCPSGTGSVEVSLADRPSASATFSAITSHQSFGSYLPFIAPGEGQYVIDLEISQGALEISGVPGIVQSSGEYSLGTESAGDNDILVETRSGPQAIWTATIRELPVAINALVFEQSCMAAGKGVLAKFSTTGQTSLTAQVKNSLGQTVRELGTFPVNLGSSSIPWDGRGAGGTALPNGIYTLELTSHDPGGGSSSATASVTVASAGPSIALASPLSIGASSPVSFQLGNTACGIASAKVIIDGKKAAEYEGAERYFTAENEPIPPTGLLTINPESAWSVGAHSWKVEAKDSVGNRTTKMGSFNVHAPLPHCLIPNVLGRRPAAGKRAIRAAHCKVGHVGHRRSRFAGRIVKVKPSVGTRWPAGKRVTIVVGKP